MARVPKYRALPPRSSNLDLQACARPKDHALAEQREANSATRRAGQLREQRGDTVATVGQALLLQLSIYASCSQT